MPSQIRIHHPATGPADFWIEKAFLTVGSTATADVCVGVEEDAPPASANVRYSDGQYKFFNQSFEGVTLDNQAVVRGKSVVWAVGSRLRFAEGVELELLSEGNAAPSPKVVTIASPARPVPQVAPPAVDDLADASTADDLPVPLPRKSKRSSEMLQVFVIVLCVGGCIGMIVANSQKSVAPEAVRDDFLELVTEGYATGKAEPSDVQRKAQWTHRLQAAERAFRKGDAASARQQYSLLKSKLATAQRSLQEQTGKPDQTNKPDQFSKPDEGSLQAFERRLLRYAERQLSRIP